MVTSRAYDLKENGEARGVVLVIYSGWSVLGQCRVINDKYSHSQKLGLGVYGRCSC